MRGVVDVVLDDAPSCAVAVDALTYAYPGCDAVLHCNGDLAVMQQVAAACGTLSEAAVARAEAALARRAAPPADLVALTAAWEALMGAAADG